jgi:hypothetical protein
MDRMAVTHDLASRFSTMKPGSYPRAPVGKTITQPEIFRTPFSETYGGGNARVRATINQNRQIAFREMIGERVYGSRSKGGLSVQQPQATMEVRVPVYSSAIMRGMSQYAEEDIGVMGGVQAGLMGVTPKSKQKYFEPLPPFTGDLTESIRAPQDRLPRQAPERGRAPMGALSVITGQESRQEQMPGLAAIQSSALLTGTTPASGLITGTIPVTGPFVTPFTGGGPPQLVKLPPPILPFTLPTGGIGGGRGVGGRSRKWLETFRIGIPEGRFFKMPTFEEKPARKKKRGKKR